MPGCVEYFGEGWWVVSEGVTGMKLYPHGPGTCNTKEDATAGATEHVKRMDKAGLVAYIRGIYDSGAASPRYQEYPEEEGEEEE